MGYDFDRLRQVSGKVAVIGIGDSDYGEDYRTSTGHSRSRGVAGAKDAYMLAAVAFKRALEDSGISKDEIDGLAVSGTIESEVICELFGLTPKWGSTLKGMPDLLPPLAVQAIHAGSCNTVAIINGMDFRSQHSEWGGSKTVVKHRLCETYFHPWGYSSPGKKLGTWFTSDG